MDDNNHLLFVYGTLKYGFPNNDKLIGADFIGDYEIDGAMMLKMTYMPAMYLLDYSKPANRKHKVRGELWSVSDKHISEIDKLEGHPKLFERVQLCWIPLAPGRQQQVLTYVWKGHRDGFPFIEEWTEKPRVRDLLLL